jgi:putative ABC transport system permease protein
MAEPRKGRGLLRSGLRVWRMLLRAQLREQPGRTLLTVVAIAIGVALFAAVALVNATALDEFTHATQRLIGAADVVVRGTGAGFDESLYATLARDPQVAVASPVLELEAALPARRDTLKVLALDPFRAGALQVALLAELGPQLLDLFAADAVFLSPAAAASLRVARGDRFSVIVGTEARVLRVAGILPAQAYPQSLALMDIASAQLTLGRLGVLNRIDLRLRGGVDAAAFRTRLAARLPPGVAAIAPQLEVERAVTLTRAYRVNLNMLALVSLWTGAFLVFSTQSLSVLRRRRSLALLRALGVTRGELQWALVGEGAALGTVGGVLGVAGGVAVAALLLRFIAADLGNSQLHIAGAALVAQPWLLGGFVAIGTVVASLGAWLPARGAAREPPARGLKGGDADLAGTARDALRAGVALSALGALLAWLPPVAGLPVFGYLAIAALLFGAILLVPALTVRVLRATPRTGRLVLDTAVAHQRPRVGLATLGLAAVIVSFSLMVAMAIMVYSFRISFEHWLGKLLPADLELRVPFGNDTAFWSPQDQARIAATAGVERVRFRRIRPLLLEGAASPVTLIARDLAGETLAAQLPLVSSVAGAPPAGSVAAYISEALGDLRHLRPGDTFRIPVGTPPLRLAVMGTWRDYARSTGTVVIDRAAYITASGDTAATDASLWLAAGADAAQVEQSLRRRLGSGGDAVEILTSGGVRARSLQIFDRAFAITYALEAVAVLIGLAGVGFAAGATALARRAEFGMLRHVGMLRSQVRSLIAWEGVLTSLFGVLYGLGLGAVLSLVLVFVVNRQSFGWSIDLAVPAWQLALVGCVLVATSALAATLSGRAAMSQSALRAVREDW